MIPKHSEPIIIFAITATNILAINILLNDIFGVPVEDKFHGAANHVDGAMSILTGVAANKSIASGMPVKIDSLVRF